jgi:pimeloyl-ACP methyl ester carboxylesterase
LVHGSPSSMVKYRRWFSDPSFFGKTKLVAVDRPGYGKSGYGRSVASIARQAELLAPVVEKLSQRGPIVVYGSSYGGSVAARLAMNHPDKIKALVLQSASVQPNAERTPKIARVIRSPAGLVFPKWARVATREKFAHSSALEDIQDGWSHIECPVWILHGGLDDLIYPSNAEHAYQQLYPHTEVHYTCFDSLGHRIYWQKSDTIRHYILEALRNR